MDAHTSRGLQIWDEARKKAEEDKKDLDFDKIIAEVSRVTDVPVEVGEVESVLDPGLQIFLAALKEGTS